MTIIRIAEGSVKARRQALALLRSGGVIIFPTDTVYGVGGDAKKRAVEQRVRRLKRRSAGKHFPWLVADLAVAKRFVRFSPEALRFAKEVWPGNTTLILPKRRGRGGLALRVPNHPWLLRLLSEFDQPLIGTSANISGKRPARSAFAAAHLLPKVDAVFDGRTLKGRPSRILDLTGVSPRLLRR